MRVTSIERKDNNLLTVKEVADKFRVKPGAIYNKVSKGEIDYIKLFGKVLFEPSYIDNLINQSKIKSKQTIKSEYGLQ
ncbi:MAG: helix-turn-helix domain-containing protein [Melioribacteraceae bacterium]|jgi:hypothetical protein|nr:helix-turn-helix domain-containing protein [Melioribacteraceae bacterium]